MAVTNFQQTIWSKSIQKELKTITSLRNHCDFQYEKDTKNAKEVKILSVTRPTIRTYTPGSSLTLEGLTDASLTLELNQYRYFNFEVEDIDKAQSVPGLMEDASRQAALGLAEEGDKYVASLIEAGVEAVSNSLGQSATVISLTKSNAVGAVEDGFAYLYEKNCRVNDTFYLEVAPKVFTIYRQALTELSTDNPEVLKKGAVGKINNAYVCIENLLPTGATGTGSDDIYYNVLRTSKAIAFAEQIDKVEAYRPHDFFQDALKGLYVFGAKIVRPDEIYVIKTAM
ncbi:MAG: hypothetical protein LIR50_07165 [Bacillota bacterium]|nr:hypothetical protein [Bacillota bacterium]